MDAVEDAEEVWRGMLEPVRGSGGTFDRIYKIYRIKRTGGDAPRVELACGDFAALGGYPRPR
jgi:hypothetical protein